MAAATSTPDKVTVARRLDADPEQLEQFVTNHPDPSVGVVLRSSVTSKPPRRVPDETRVLLAEWIAQRKERQRDGPRRRILDLDEHGPTPSSSWPSWLRPGRRGQRKNDGFSTVVALERGGYIHTPDDESGRVFRLCNTGE